MKSLSVLALATPVLGLFATGCAMTQSRSGPRQITVRDSLVRVPAAEVSPSAPLADYRYWVRVEKRNGTVFSALCEAQGSTIECLIGALDKGDTFFMKASRRQSAGPPPAAANWTQESYGYWPKSTCSSKLTVQFGNAGWTGTGQINLQPDRSMSVRAQQHGTRCYYTLQ